MSTFIQRSALAFAAVLAAAMSLQARAADRQLPPERDAGIASFVSGGIGEGESARFESAFKQYPLVVQLFENNGQRDEYTADATVKIVDAKGRLVMSEKSDGPFMLVRLPAGDYRVEASMQGRSLAEHAVHITDSGHVKTTFVFPRTAS